MIEIVGWSGSSIAPKAHGGFLFTRQSGDRQDRVREGERGVRIPSVGLSDCSWLFI
jgi:hypothetical protein